MKVRLFGKNSDDKGKQLEVLTQRLLERLGYRQITLNFVGSGGNEIDIRAEYPVPSISRENVLRLIGECKAYEAPIALPEWLKFLGKLYTEKVKHNGIRGLFVALSGVNGNVAGAYDDLRNHDNSVELISGDNLAAHILNEFKLPDVSQFLARIKQLTADSISAVSLGYYEGFAFWIAEFANSTFAGLFGESLDQGLSPELAVMVSGQIEAAKYRDLLQEQVAKNRLSLARKYVLGRLLNKEPIELPRQEDFFPPDLRIMQADIETACTELLAEGKLVQNAAVLGLADIEHDLPVRAIIIQEILSGIFILPHIATPAWDSLIDDALLCESLRIKEDLVIQEANRSALVQLMKWSPIGLLWALRPDEILCGHRKSPEAEAMLGRDHARYYQIQMLNFAINDFQNPVLKTVLHEHHGLRELEFTRHGIFKSEERVELDLSLTERFAIARFDPSLGGGLGHVWLVENAPQPWSARQPEADTPPIANQPKSEPTVKH